MLFIRKTCILGDKWTDMRILVCLFFLSSWISLPSYGQSDSRRVAWKNKILEQIESSLRANPLAHPAFFTIQQLDLEEKSKGAVIHGKGTCHYSWSRITPDLDTLVVFSHQQSITYQRTESWEQAQSKVTTSFTQAIVRYARQWWQKNGPGSPALIDSVRLEWLPDLAIDDPDTLYYPLKKLSWSDFRGTPRSMSRYSAEIFSNMGFDLEMEVKNHQLLVRLRGKCYMVRGISWVRPGNANPYTLAHEQLHFDITQRSLEAWKEQVNALPQYWHPDDWSTAIQQAFLTTFRQMNRWQTTYDQETIHGQNEMKQAEWTSQFGIKVPN